VILIAGSPYRCDAVILENGEYDSVALNCSQDDLFDHASTLRDPALRQEGDTGLRSELAWLWDIVTGPVLAKLGKSAPVREPSSNAPRVWWCPTGPAAFLPLHAAGHYPDHASGAPVSAMDCVVSSYTPTLSALRRQVREGTPEPGETPKPAGTELVVEYSLPQDDATARAQTEEEAAELRRHLPAAQVLRGSGATAEAVLAALPTARTVHFACHATTHPRWPALNSLTLYDHASRPLTVLELSQASVSHGQLAYLDACTTAASPQALSEEAVHIASTFQMLGYRHVVGTLWPSRPRPSRYVSQHFYDHLTLTDTHDNVARSLHRAVSEIRGAMPVGSEALWAPFIHLGP
jgi:hypothetical protein